MPERCLANVVGKADRRGNLYHQEPTPPGNWPGDD